MIAVLFKKDLTSLGLWALASGINRILIQYGYNDNLSQEQLSLFTKAD